MSGLVSIEGATVCFVIATVSLTYLTWESIRELRRGAYYYNVAWSFVVRRWLTGYEEHHRIQPEHIGAGIVAVFCIFLIGLYRWSIQPEPWRGWLQAANDPTPPTACDRGVYRPEALLVLGREGIGLFGEGHSRALSIGDCDNLSLERSADGIKVNAELYDVHGNTLGNIVGNGYKIERNGVIIERSGDLSTLVVHDKDGTELLYIKNMNREAVKVRGIFSCPSVPGVHVIITDNNLRIGSTTMSDCMTNVGTGLCIFCRRGHP